MAVPRIFVLRGAKLRRIIMRDMKFLSGILLLGALLTGCRDARDRTAELGAGIAALYRTSRNLSGGVWNLSFSAAFLQRRQRKDSAGWVRRRAEIRTRWDSLLGAWPPVIAGQRFEYADTLPGEDFDRYRVRFRWLPSETTEGYLLVPHRKGRKPAVITLFYEPETAVGLGGKPNRDFALRLGRTGLCRPFARDDANHPYEDLFALLSLGR